ncbi:MAG: DUF4886 domain-containing protein [Ruminococcaceae bacterium]|nr:DUF4886 domain-containing protein [Oscillospiraceae bacterium]
MKTHNTPLTDGKTLKLLAITSSFGLNTTECLYDIAIAEGFTDVTVARLYKGACTLEMHMDYAENKIPKYQYTKKCDSEWTVINGVTMEHGIMDEDWDIIFIQQSAEESPLANTFSDYVPRLIEYVRRYKPDARFVWNMTWAYDKECGEPVFDEIFQGDQIKMYNAIVNTVREKIIAEKADVERIIPTGTAIQNARIANSPKLTRDRVSPEKTDHIHLNAYGRLIAGYTLFATLTDRDELTSIRVDKPSQAFHYRNDPPLEITDKDKALILEAVNNALKDPYNITLPKNVL